MTGLVIGLLVALIGAFGYLTVRAGKRDPQEDSEVLEDCCGDCTNRYPMSSEDFKQFPCATGHRCSLDGEIIEDMRGWCIHHKLDTRE